MRGLPDYALPEIGPCMELNLLAARRVNPKCVFVGICLNTAAMGEADAAALKAKLAREFALPCVDPLKDGVAAVVDRVLEL